MATDAFHVVEVGHGPPVLLLHGLGAASHVWQPLVALAQARVRLVAVDLPCSGRSGAYCTPTPEALADYLAGMLGRRVPGRALVVGHSFGGVVALALAVRHPERLAGLLVMSAPAYGLGPLGALLALPPAAAAFHLLERARPPRALVHAYLRRQRGRPAPLGEAQLAAYVAAMRARGFYPSMLEALRALRAFRLPAGGLGQAPFPRALLWGACDRLVPPAQGERLAAALGVPLEVLPGVGHCVPEERPEAVLRALEALVHAGARARLTLAPLTREEEPPGGRAPS